MLGDVESMRLSQVAIKSLSIILIYSTDNIKPPLLNALSIILYLLPLSIELNVKECMQHNSTSAVQASGMLPKFQFGCRSGPNPILALTMFVKDAWRREKVAVALFLHVKGAFPNAVVGRLVHDMRMRGVLEGCTAWIERNGRAENSPDIGSL